MIEYSQTVMLYTWLTYVTYVTRDVRDLRAANISSNIFAAYYSPIHPKLYRCSDSLE